MSISQLRKEIGTLKRAVIQENHQTEYYMLNAAGELKAKINQIHIRLGDPEDVEQINAEELKTDIMARLSQRMKDPFFKRYVRGL